MNDLLKKITMCRTSVSNGQLETLEGTFLLSTLSDRLVFYLEGPSPGVDLLIEFVTISCPNNTCEIDVSKFSNLFANMFEYLNARTDSKQQKGIIF